MKRNINGGFVETRASLVDVCVCVCGRRSVGRLIMQRIIRSSSELMRDGRGVCTCPRRGDEIICSATYDTARQNSISFRIV